MQGHQLDHPAHATPIRSCSSRDSGHPFRSSVGSPGLPEAAVGTAAPGVRPSRGRPAGPWRLEQGPGRHFCIGLPRRHAADSTGLGGASPSAMHNSATARLAGLDRIVRTGYAYVPVACCSLPTRGTSGEQVLDFECTPLPQTRPRSETAAF